MFRGEINTNGRPKGSSNKVTAEVKSLIAELLTENADEVRARMRRLKDLEFIKVYLQLTKFVVPQMRAIIQEPPKEEPPVYQIEVLNGKGETISTYETKRKQGND